MLHGDSLGDFILAGLVFGKGVGYFANVETHLPMLNVTHFIGFLQLGLLSTEEHGLTPHELVVLGEFEEVPLEVTELNALRMDEVQLLLLGLLVPLNVLPQKVQIFSPQSCFGRD